MAAATGQPPAESVEEAFAEVWDRAYPVTVQRIGSIEEAATELAREHPDAARLDAGRSDAQKLAGVLGTFGLDRGTQLARGLEARLQARTGPAAAREAHRMAMELRSLVDCVQRDSR
jgi:HPt (histidine-containing phosphotransfer) domain-containing protein